MNGCVLTCLTAWAITCTATTVLGISKDRLTRLQRINREEVQHSIVQMSKFDMEEQRLGNFVIMPADVDTSFTKWWKSLDQSAAVDVRYPHRKHGNALKSSHSAKTSTMEDFLKFVDVNSQPNGRSADSTGPTAYFCLNLPPYKNLKLV